MLDAVTDPSTSERHASGRPLDLTRDDALREAALSLLAEIGYDRLTMDAIAQRACAGKATIYRRWANKGELVLDALACAKPVAVVPDTGTLRGDLRSLSQHAEAKDKRLDTQVMIGLVSALPHDEELRAAFHERMVRPHVETLTAIFNRAVERGEIPLVRNPEIVASIFPALMLHQLLFFGRAPDPQFFETVIEDVILPLVLVNADTDRTTPHPK